MSSTNLEYWANVLWGSARIARSFAGKLEASMRINVTVRRISTTFDTTEPSPETRLVVRVMIVPGLAYWRRALSVTVIPNPASIVLMVRRCSRMRDWYKGRESENPLTEVPTTTPMSKSATTMAATTISTARAPGKPFSLSQTTGEAARMARKTATRTSARTDWAWFTPQMMMTMDAIAIRRRVPPSARACSPTDLILFSIYGKNTKRSRANQLRIAGGILRKASLRGS